MVRAPVVALLVALLAGCAAPARQATDPAFVGGSDDGALTVAVAVHDGRATGLTTDAAGTAVWFTGTAGGGVLDLHAPDGAELVGGIHGVVVHGRVGDRGTGTAFTAVRAEAPAGLYRADAVDGGDGRIAWVRFPDGTSRGAAEVDGSPVAAPEPADGLVVGGVRFGPPVRVVGGTVTGP